MTKQAETVIKECDLLGELNTLLWLERLVVGHTTKQIISLIWKKDPEGNHDIEWFFPFFDNNYVPKILNISVIFDPFFWEAYWMLHKFVEPFDANLLPLINEMSEDTLRLEQAIRKSKPNIKYVYKVWQNIEPIDVQVTNIIDLPEIKKHEVRTTELT